jgi:uncharacterized protein (UPF0333 family)
MGPQVANFLLRLFLIMCLVTVECNLFNSVIKIILLLLIIIIIIIIIIINAPAIVSSSNWNVTPYSHYTHHREHMSRGHHPTLRDVTADTENTASSLVACLQSADQIRCSMYVNIRFLQNCHGANHRIILFYKYMFLF